MNPTLSLTFHGAARTTTGSRHVVDVLGRRILLDCGLYQGRRSETYRRNLHFGFDPSGVDAVILSHAHIDHTGNLPNLVRQGFEGPIYGTPATMDLCRVMLLDSAHIQEKDAEWVTKRRRKQGTDGRAEPLYTSEDVEDTFPLFQSADYHRPQQVFHGVRFMYLDAGHILGSASVIMDVQNDGTEKRLAFSGDIGRPDRPILRDPEIPGGVDWLIMEGTYGSREQDTAKGAKEELGAVIRRVAARGGKIVVPSFSVERTQEIVYHLKELTEEGAVPRIPVYVDSPLSVNVTDIFRLHPECFDREARKRFRDGGDPFGFDRLRYIKEVEESKKLNANKEPCMIISASGMCESGRILHHLRNSIGDPKNCVMIVGYQASHTLGRRIVERRPEVKIFGEPHPLRAEVVTLNAMSGHADKNGLFDYASKVKVFLVHGEEDALEEFGGRLRKELDLEAIIPEQGEEWVV